MYYLTEIRDLGHCSVIQMLRRFPWWY